MANTVERLLSFLTGPWGLWLAPASATAGLGFGGLPVLGIPAWLGSLNRLRALGWL